MGRVVEGLRRGAARRALSVSSPMSMSTLPLVLVAALMLTSTGSALRLLEVRVPRHAVLNQDARLECHFDLEGEVLYSVKWYKDGHEFYRFVPRDKPPAQLFQLPGISVDMSQSTSSEVHVTSVQLQTSGRYRCEVSAEAPSFQTVSEHADMLVVALPDEGPRISGGRPRYAIGDTVRVNCTSGRSRPPASLMWFINGDQAEQSQLRGPYLDPPPELASRDDLQTSVLGLVFRVRARHFMRGDLKLKCLATIATVYWRSNEESVEGERPQRAPALPSRPGGIGIVNAPPGSTVDGDGGPPHSRADRVHAHGGGHSGRQCSLRPFMVMALVSLPLTVLCRGLATS